MSAAAKSRPLPQSKGSTPTAASNGRNKPSNNAWARPLQPGSKPGPPPGMGGPSSSKASTAPPVLRERFLHLTLSMVGQKVVVTRTNGAILEGVLHTFTPFPSQPKERRNVYVLKACKSIKIAGEDDDAVPTGSTLILPADQVANVLVKSMRLDTPSNAGTPNHSSHGGNKTGDPFRTDTEISHPSQDGKRRELVMADSSWTSGGVSNSRAAGLLGEDDKRPTRKGFKQQQGPPGDLEGSIGRWDQFKANEELFQVRAGFDENIYTTELDKSQIDRQKVLEAERLAKEIESTASSNFHIAEERGQMLAVDYDEEDRYSGVLQKQPAKGAPKKTMNYAAAAAKADVSKQGGAVPPGFAKPGEAEEVKMEGEREEGAANPEEKKEDVPGEAEPKRVQSPVPDAAAEKKEVPTPVTPEVSAAAPIENEAGETAPPKPEGGEAEAKPEANKVATKLNVNAKEFTFNPGAKTFTPGGGGPAQYEMPLIDPNTGMPMGQLPMHYMQHPGMQPGMMPMMGPPYVRYPGGPYPGMEQHMGMPPPHQPQHMPPPPPPPQHDGTSSEASGDDQQGSDGPPPGPHQPQQGMPMPYGPQGMYYPAGMMPPRGPGGPPMYAQQQMQYRPPYGGPMPPNMGQMPGLPYYQGPPMGGMRYQGGGYPGQGGMMENDYQGGRGGRGGGRGFRGRGRGGYNKQGRGRGGGSYQYNSGGSGRQTPQSGSESNEPVDDRVPPSSASESSKPSTPTADPAAESKPATGSD